MLGQISQSKSVIRLMKPWSDILTGGSNLDDIQHFVPLLWHPTVVSSQERLILVHEGCNL